ncbi:hypothetical protein [Haematobacter genomosp. 1]|uniref:Uncharacterized protein n=1 Tax=Haematobacter genomosp. 1 TaxID=366618 RepID=A0A212AA24_9RHOB|nr:hypothetical protein [Haematobacter genomosp. 1]OWJ76984.1 hypothetical protein CDV49_12565 [Haematobacter genomosp. 1]
MPNLISAAVPGLPSATLAEIHDLLTLALDATEKEFGYTDTEREARSYTRRARARITSLLAPRAI